MQMAAQIFPLLGSLSYTVFIFLVGRTRQRYANVFVLFTAYDDS